MTNERPRLNHHASATAPTSAAMGPAVLRPASDGGSGRPAKTSMTAAAMMAPGTQTGRSSFRRSFT